MLEHTFRRVLEETGDPRVTRANLPQAERILLEELDRSRSQFRISPKQTRVRAAARRLEFDLVRHLGREADRDGTFVPNALELRFGEGENVEHGPVEIGDGLLVSGRIDRVDTSDGMALVIDYKSGRRVDSYKVASWESENRFQAALYMLAVEKLLGKRAVGGVYVALGSEDPRPRGMLADDVPGLGSGWVRQRPRASRGVRGEARVGARADRRHGRRDPPRRAHLHARLLRLSGRLLVPVAVPVRAMSLTPEQQQVVDRREGPLLVRAGAGTGKTTVLVERFVRAVVDDGVAVEGMLAITFTDKAAAEMRERVRARFLELGRRDDARSAEGASISTIHGFCGRLLRTHALSRGHRPRLPRARRAGGRARGGRRLRPGAGGLPRPHRRRQARARGVLHARRRARHGSHRLLAPAQPRPALPQPRPGANRRGRRASPSGWRRRRAPPWPSWARPRGRPRRRRARRSVAAWRCSSRLTGERLATPTQLKDLELKKGNAKALSTAAFDEYREAFGAYRDLCLDSEQARNHALLRVLLELYGRRYGEAKQARSALDFEDLELLARDLLAGDEGLREQYSARYTHVMVDEFQDVNPLQSQLIGLVARDNLFRVGDENQSIYGFRHADVNVFREHRAAAAEQGQALSVTVNFRSRGELIDAVALASSGSGATTTSRCGRRRARASRRWASRWWTCWWWTSRRSAGTPPFLPRRGPSARAWPA